MIYEYECKKCGKLEIIHSMKEDRNSQKCPYCEETLKSLISRNFNFVIDDKAPWEYKDIQKAIKSGNKFINDNTTITDKRDGSKTYGQKVKAKDLR